ncbi:unnamed protein product [Adineta steineri]|uniref:Uncharacterized protein n=1 Tax=Adineta steineri TaxID=433720 RepID=A0A813QJS7_9BILA|nr:unnamed protein product [Adineta steineri]CAF1506217.1 unnamed protein product [Adineta steineri]
MYLLLILIITVTEKFALPNSHVMNVNNSQSINESISRSISKNAWSEIKTNHGKDRLNSYHLKHTRGNIIKFVFTIIGVVCILIIIGGTISTIVYYIKKT